MLDRELLAFISERNNFINNTDFSRYKLSDIEKIIGKEKSNFILKTWTNSPKCAVIWFYSPLYLFNGKSPYEIYSGKCECEKERLNFYFDKGELPEF